MAGAYIVNLIIRKALTFIINSDTEKRELANSWSIG